MTTQEVDRLCLEFSDEFDVLYNNISSNQAPGLDQYEKSLFLTRALDEIVKSYFSPYLNKVQTGYDGNERRQIDFSMITKSKVFEDNLKAGFYFYAEPKSSNDRLAIPWKDIPIKVSEQCQEYFVCTAFSSEGKPGAYNVYPSNENPYKGIKNAEELLAIFVIELDDKYIYNISGETALIIDNPSEYRKRFEDPVFDLRENTRSITLNEDDILVFINQYVEVIRDGKKVRLMVDPITYTEYTRIMSKPYKRPVKNKAWRLIDSTEGTMKSELIIGPTDILEKYVIRYIKRPLAIILDNFGTEEYHDVTINGRYTKQACELDPILFPEIILRAVELAWAAYKEPSLNNQITLGQSSLTNIGAVQTSGRRDE